MVIELPPSRSETAARGREKRRGSEVSWMSFADVAGKLAGWGDKSRAENYPTVVWIRLDLRAQKIEIQQLFNLTIASRIARLFVALIPIDFPA